MLHQPIDIWNDDNIIYDDGEWITCEETNSHLERLEFDHHFPLLDVNGFRPLSAK